jgi:hypothetical protein
MIRYEVVRKWQIDNGISVEPLFTGIKIGTNFRQQTLIQNGIFGLQFTPVYIIERTINFYVDGILVHQIVDRVIF